MQQTNQTFPNILSQVMECGVVDIETIFRNKVYQNLTINITIKI